MGDWDNIMDDLAGLDDLLKVDQNSQQPSSAAGSQELDEFDKMFTQIEATTQKNPSAQSGGSKLLGQKVVWMEQSLGTVRFVGETKVLSSSFIVFSRYYVDWRGIG